ncbi:MAG: sensor histidine kinase, partial [Alphaproteobacteria bacterium]
LAGASLLTLALSLALVVWVTRLLTRPLKQLAAAADRRLDRPAPPARATRVREINIVAEALADEAAERAKLVERQRLLLREMAHRMLNQFTVVSSIFYQTSAAAGSIEELAEAFEARLQGLSRTVLALAQEEWRAVPLRELVKAHLAPLVGADDARIRLDGPEFRANPAAVEMLGLALHELATNSLKYGALSAEAGSVRIAWRRAGAGAGDGFWMEWRETGGPPPPSGRTGFGSLVLGEIVPAQLDGAASLRFDPQGLVWHLDCPWGKIAD